MKNPLNFDLLEKKLIFIKIFYTVKKKISNNFFFWYLFFLMKFLGVFIITNNYTKTDIYFIQFLRYLVYFKTLENELNINSYRIISTLIYFLLILPIFLIFFVYNQKITCYSRPEFLLKLNPTQKILTKFCSFLLIFILIFSQHIIEILSFSIINTFTQIITTNPNFNLNIYKSRKIYLNILNFNNAFIFSSIPTLILNIFFIAVINFIIFYFIKYSNDITTGLNSKFKMNKSIFLHLGLTIIGNLQSFQYYDLIFDKTNTNINLILSIIILILLLYPCVNLIIDLVFKSSIGKFLINLLLISIILGVLNLIFSDLENSFFLVVVKLIFSASLSFLIFSSLEKQSFEKIINKFKNNLFENNKKIDLKLLLLLIQKLTDKKELVENIYFFMELINNHKKECRQKKCNCLKYKIFDDIENVELKNPKEINEMINYIIEVIENELFGSILNTNLDTFKYHSEFCLLHIDFVYSVKKSEFLAYYLIDVYINKFNNEKNLFGNSIKNTNNFYILFKLFEFKKRIFKAYFINKKYKQIKSYININFLNDINFIKNLLLKNFNNYEKLYGLKKNILNNFLYETGLKKTSSFNLQKFHLNFAKLNNISYQLEDIIFLCEELAEDYKTLKKYLQNTFAANPIRNSEIGYLLYNFFYLFNKKIPFSLKLLFSANERYENILLSDMVYREIDMKHPIIIKVDENMNFNIKYISQKLCDYISYEKSELIDQEINILLPDIFTEIHSKIIKNFIFIEKKKKLNLESFLITKKHHYLAINLKISIFLCMDFNLNILIDIKPLNIRIEKGFEEFNFILDKEMNVICFSSGFEEKYSLNLDFFLRHKISFCDLFGINTNLLITNFEEDIKIIEKKEFFDFNINENDNKNINLNNFTSSNNNKNINSRKNILNKIVDKSKNKKENTIKNINEPRSQFVQYLIRKDNLIQSILKLKNSFYEKDDNKDFYDILANFEKKINDRIVDLNYFARQQSFFSFTNFPPGSFILKNSKNNNNNNNRKLDLYNIKFNLYNIGNIPYYMIRITDLDFAGTLNNTNISNSLNSSTQSIINTLNTKIYNEKRSQNLGLFSLFKNSENNFTKPNMGTYKEESIISNYNSTNRSILMNNNTNSRLFPNSANQLNFLNINNKSNFINGEIEKKIDFDKLNKNFYTNNTYSSTKSKKKYHSFATQNKKQETKKKFDSNLKRKFLVVFYLMFFISFILLVYDYPLKSSILNHSHKLSEINYYILGMKADVLATSSAIISACTRVDNIDPYRIKGFENSLEKIKEKIGERSNDLNSFTYKFYSYLDDLNYYGIDELYKIINNINDYNFIYTDWTVYKRSSSFITQLKNFNYFCSIIKIKNQFNTCRVRERFYNKNFIFNYEDLTKNKNFEFLKKEEISEIINDKNQINNIVSSTENILYYIFENILTIFKNNLLNLTIISNSILEDYHLNSSTNLFIYNTINLIVLIFTIILMFYYIVYSKNMVMLIFIKLFNNKNSDKFLEAKLVNFKSILISFDQNKCIEFENRKIEINQNEEKLIIIASNTGSITSNKNEEKKKPKEKKSNRNSVSPRINSKDLKSSIRTDLISVNSSFLNNNILKNNLKDSEGGNIDIYNDEFLEKIKFDNLNLKIYLFGKIFLFFGGCAIIALILINLIDNSSKFKGLIKGNMIASNFLERMPKFCELILYYKISIIYNDVFFITNKNSEENKKLNYYNVSINVEKEGNFNQLKDSQFYNLYKQFKTINSNIGIFMNYENDKILENIRILENQLNSKDFCFYLSKTYMELSGNYKGDILQGFKEINRNAEECKSIGNGINSNSLNLILENILSIIKNNYFDFVNSKGKNITQFIGNDDIVRANLEIEYVFKKIHDSIMLLIKSDIDEMYKFALNSEMGFYSASIVVFFFYVFIFLGFVIRKLYKYNRNLTYTLKRFNKTVVKV